MAANLQKSTNFFHLTEPSAGELNALVSGAFVGGGTSTWTWTLQDDWKNPLGGKYIMKVAANSMVMKRLGPRKLALTIAAPSQYVRTHRFVYKLDAFNGADYLFTIVTPPFQSQVEKYGAASDLTFVGRFPEQITAAEAAAIVWIRRGAGEWRD